MARRQRCAITGPAKELLARLDPLVSRADSECLESLDDGQKRRLVTLLKALLNGLQEHEPPARCQDPEATE